MMGCGGLIDAALDCLAGALVFEGISKLGGSFYHPILPVSLEENDQVTGSSWLESMPQDRAHPTQHRAHSTQDRAHPTQDRTHPT